MKIVISEKQLKVILDELIIEQKYDRDYVDFLLDKIKSSGMSSLGQKEKDYLDKVSRGEDIEDEIESDESEYDDSDLPDMFRVKDDDEYESPQFEGGAEQLMEILADAELIDFEEVEPVGENGVRIYGIKNDMNELFDGHIASFVSKLPRKFVMFISNVDVSPKNYRKIVNFIKNEWPKVVGNLEIEIVD